MTLRIFVNRLVFQTEGDTDKLCVLCTLGKRPTRVLAGALTNPLGIAVWNRSTVDNNAGCTGGRCVVDRLLDPLNGVLSNRLVVAPHIPVAEWGVIAQRHAIRIGQFTDLFRVGCVRMTGQILAFELDVIQPEVGHVGHELLDGDAEPDIHRRPNTRLAHRPPSWVASAR